MFFGNYFFSIISFIKLFLRSMGSVKISICIPAYKRIAFLKRLLLSIEAQSFRDFEVIISDDSNDDSVLQLIQDFNDKFPIQYFKNQKALGTPANWNFAITKAKGEWIKLMHDDDWFSSENSLEKFVKYTNEGNKFIFSAYANCIENTNKKQKVFFPDYGENRIVNYPVTLFAQNIIGPPSVTMVHRSIAEQYDELMKWRVDLDFYIRILLKEKNFSCINEVLINVGVGETQVTNTCINVASVELPEGYLLLEKHGTKPLKHILVYDAWWRILRNINIRSKKELEQFGQTNWPKVIQSIVGLQSIIPGSILKIGVVSKVLMMYSYFINVVIKSNLD